MSLLATFKTSSIHAPHSSCSNISNHSLHAQGSLCSSSVLTVDWGLALSDILDHTQASAAIEVRPPGAAPLNANAVSSRLVADLIQSSFTRDAERCVASPRGTARRHVYTRCVQLRCRVRCSQKNVFEIQHFHSFICAS